MTFQCYYADVQLVPPSAVLADRMKSKAVPTVAARLRTKAVETQYHRDVDLPVSVNRLHVTAPIPRPYTQHSTYIDVRVYEIWFWSHLAIHIVF